VISIATASDCMTLTGANQERGPLRNVCIPLECVPSLVPVCRV